MHHIGTQPIGTERLLLRCCMEEDAEKMFENWASDRRVTEFLAWESHACVQTTQHTVARWVEQYADPACYHWMITLHGEPVGTIGLYEMEEDWQSCELGYCLGVPWWNQGYATEAACAVLRYIFTGTDMYRVAGAHDICNIGSGRVMEKIGMTYEGRLRQNRASRHGGRSDTCLYSILRPEWYAGTSPVHTSQKAKAFA